jgi:hypothetical protein
MPQTARDEMDALLNMTLTFSQQMLEEHGEFYSHGASIDSSGELQLAGAYTGEEHPPDTELIQILYDAFRDQAAEGKIRAAAVASDVRLTLPGADEPGDAIRVGIEHAEADPVFVFLPYAKEQQRGIDYGEVFAVRGESHVFIAAENR